MKRKIVFEAFDNTRVPDCDTHVQIGFQKVIDALADGWVLDSSMYQSGGRAQPMRLDNTVVYHLVKYTEADLEQLQKEILEATPTENIRDVISADFAEVKQKISDGYVVHQIYQKNVILKKLDGGEKTAWQKMMTS